MKYCREATILAVIVGLLCKFSQYSDRVILSYDKDGSLSVSSRRLRTWHTLKPPVPSWEELLTTLEALGFRVSYDEKCVDGQDERYCTIHSPWEPVKHRSCGSIFYPTLKESDSIK